MAPWKGYLTPFSPVRFVPPAKEFKLVLQFRKNTVERNEIIAALRRIIEALEAQD